MNPGELGVANAALRRSSTRSLGDQTATRLCSEFGEMLGIVVGSGVVFVVELVLVPCQGVGSTSAADDGNL